MKFKLSFFAAILTVGASLLTAPGYANADTYQIFDLGPQLTSGGPTIGIRIIYGIDTAGDVVIKDFAGCAANPSGWCYEIWVDGVNTASNLLTPPSLTYDDGTPCAPNSLSSEVTGLSYCNNGREVFEGTLTTPQTSISGLFTGPDPLTDLLYSGQGDQLFINASGDIAWSGHPFSASGQVINDENYEAIDLTTESVIPEPANMVLVATGALAAVGAARRRFVRSI